MNQQDMQEQVTSCNYCESKNFHVLHHYSADYYHHNAYITYPWDGNQHVSLTIVKCDNCGLVFQNPRFKLEHLGLLYTDSVEKKIDLENAVAKHKFGPLVDLIKKNCAFSANQFPVSVDIGTRYGLLPEILRRNGFNAFGIEYNKLCVETAVNSGFRNVYEGTIESLDVVMNAARLNRINMVTMTDVIEHLLDPINDLKKLSSYQQKGDFMVIQTVDIGSVGYKIFRKWWYHIHGQHTYYFDEKSLRLYYDKLGYDIVDVLKVGKLNNLTILPSVIRKFFFHKNQRKKLNQGPELKSKIWFAETRPTLFDIITIVAKKR